MYIQLCDCKDCCFYKDLTAFGSATERAPPPFLAWDDTLLVQALVRCMHMMWLQWPCVPFGSCKLTSCTHRQSRHVCPDQEALLLMC